MNRFLVLLFIIPGIVIFLLGKYIGKTGYVEVLKSYNNKLNYDKEGLTDYVTKLMTLTSFLTIGLSLLSLILNYLIKSIDFVFVYLIVYTVLTVHYMIKLRFSCKKFEIKE